MNIQSTRNTCRAFRAHIQYYLLLSSGMYCHMHMEVHRLHLA